MNFKKIFKIINNISEIYKLVDELSNEISQNPAYSGLKISVRRLKKLLGL